MITGTNPPHRMKAFESFSAVPRLLLASLLFSASGATAAVDRSEWRLSQPLDVAAPGLIKVALPAGTLGVLRPEAADLRLLDPAAAEVACFLERPLRFAAEAPVRRVGSFQATLKPRATVLLLETGVASPIAGLALEGGSGSFLKAARIEGSADGETWQVVADGVPLYQRYQGETRLRTTFAPHAWKWLRVTLDDTRTGPVPFTDARLQVVTSGNLPGAERKPVRIVSREELPGESRLTLDLGSANLDLASLLVASDEGLFTRAASLRVRALERSGWTERVVSRGLLFRDLGADGAATREPTWLEIGESVPSREAVLVIQNGGSPPLPISGVSMELPPVRLVFYARQAGRHELLAGNPGATAPRYDLVAFAEQFKTAEPRSATFGPLAANPGFQPPAVMPDPFGFGAGLDVAAWRHRKAVPVARDGAQQLELDLEVLAHARPDLADLRLVSEGRQRPFIREAGEGWRTVPVVSAAADDPKQPAVSIWRLKLPLAGVPFVSLTADSSSTLFEREVTVSETVSDSRGEKSRRVLGEARWRRTPGGTVRPFTLAHDSGPTTDTLWLEIRNGDNAPIQLGKVALAYPATRLRFLAPQSPPTWLYYGNRNAVAPDYDLELVAARLLVAETATVIPGAEESMKGVAWSGLSLSSHGVWLFWAALGGVVAALLLVLRRMLPAPPSDL